MLGNLLSTLDFSTCWILVFWFVGAVWEGAERSKNVKSENRPVYLFFIQLYFSIGLANTIEKYNRKFSHKRTILCYYYITAQHNTR